MKFQVVFMQQTSKIRTKSNCVMQLKSCCFAHKSNYHFYYNLINVTVVKLRTSVRNLKFSGYDIKFSKQYNTNE